MAIVTRSERRRHLAFLAFLVLIEMASFVWTSHVNSPFVNVNADVPANMASASLPLVARTFGFYLAQLLNPFLAALAVWAYRRRGPRQVHPGARFVAGRCRRFRDAGGPSESQIRRVRLVRRAIVLRTRSRALQAGILFWLENRPGCAAGDSYRAGRRGTRRVSDGIRHGCFPMVGCRGPEGPAVLSSLGRFRPFPVRAHSGFRYSDAGVPWIKRVSCAASSGIEFCGPSRFPIPFPIAAPARW